jgi:hypothetical protein
MTVTEMKIKRQMLRLTEDNLDSRGDYTFTKAKKETRGGLTYHMPGPPWKKKGLKVFGKFDNGNNDWLAKNGRPGEWAVAFHGVGGCN